MCSQNIIRFLAFDSVGKKERGKKRKKKTFLKYVALHQKTKVFQTLLYHLNCENKFKHLDRQAGKVMYR